MNQTLMFLILSLGVVTATQAAEPPTYSSAPPNMGEVQLIGDILVVSRGIPMMVQEARIGKRKVGDKDETYEYTVSRTIVFPQQEAIAARDYRILDMEGRPVEQGLLAKKLGTMTPVLVSEEGRKLDSQYLALFQPGTWIVYLRPDRPRKLGQHGGLPMIEAPPPVPAPAPVPVPAGRPT